MRLLDALGAVLETADRFILNAKVKSYDVQDAYQNIKDYKIYHFPEDFDGLDVLAEVIAKNVMQFLLSDCEIENAQYYPIEDGYIVQAKDPMFSSIKGFLGTDLAIEFHLIVGRNTLTIKLGKGAWFKKLTGSATKVIVKTLVFAPLAITDIAGMVKQMKLLYRVHCHIENYIGIVKDEWNELQKSHIIINDEDDEEILENTLSVAENLFIQSKFNKAFDIFVVLVAEGNARAMFFLGQYYRTGQLGIPINYEVARRLYEKGYSLGDSLCGYGLALSCSIDNNNEKANEIFNNSFNNIQNEAKNDCPILCHIVGACYMYGWGVTQDSTKGYEWIKKSAEQGYAWGQERLGYIYENGEDVEKNCDKAMKLYKLAAEQGFSVAQSSVARLYYNGEGVDKNVKLAFEWNKQAAHQNYRVAQNALGLDYMLGDGTDVNIKLSLHWLRKSANQGFAPAQYGLGLNYEEGEGVVKSIETAVKWYKKAALQGHNEAKEAYKKITGDDIIETPSPPISVADEILKLKGLLDAGILTQDEFDQKKAQLLNL